MRSNPFERRECDGAVGERVLTPTLRHLMPGKSRPLGINVLAQQGDFRGSPERQGFDLLAIVLGGSRLLRGAAPPAHAIRCSARCSRRITSSTNADRAGSGAVVMSFKV